MLRGIDISRQILHNNTTKQMRGYDIMHRKGKTVIILLLCAALICAAAIFLGSRYAVIGGKICAADAQTLDLSGRVLKHPEKLSRLTQLRQLDLRNTGLTVEEYTSLRQALPQCQILWLVPFQGNYLPEDSTHITLAQPSSADLDALAFFPALETIDATACSDPATIQTLQERYPNCQMLYRLTMEGTQLDQTTTKVTLCDAKNIAVALGCMPQLVEIDAFGCEDPAALQALQQQYPQCRLLYNIPVGQQAFPSSAAQITLEAAASADLAQALPYFYELSAVTVTQLVEDPAAFLALEQRYPDIAFTYSFRLLGVTVSNRDTAIDLSDIPMESTEALEAALPYFRNLEKVDMCGCGISNEDMAALNQRHPETLFVWMVDIGRIRTRTDVTYFMPHLYGTKLHEGDTENLKYLTELICLDLGHQDVSSSDFLAYMTKMQYLIIIDNGITDISGCANMPDLKFAEFYVTGITDFTPLLECKKLEDLNVGYCHPEDWTVFCEMKQLTRLYWCGMHDSNRQQALREALPNTILMFEGISSTGNGWRESPNYYAMRDLLGMPYMTY